MNGFRCKGSEIFPQSGVKMEKSQAKIFSRNFLQIYVVTLKIILHDIFRVLHKFCTHTIFANMTNINIQFGKTVALKRKELNISQEELADRCGLHRTYVGALERGEKSPTLVTIEKITKGLNISMKSLWEALITD